MICQKTNPTNMQRDNEEIEADTRKKLAEAKESLRIVREELAALGNDMKDHQKSLDRQFHVAAVLLVVQAFCLVASLVCSYMGW